jgi:uncharacterized membrane protein
MLEIDPAIRDLLAGSLALIFGASGVMKIRDLEMFEGSVANYQLLPASLEKLFAYLLPILEFACAIGLMASATRGAAALGLLMLLVIFSGAIGINLMRGRTNIDCGCFGPLLRQELSGWLLLRNVFLMILAAAILLPENGRLIEPLDLVTIVLGAATLVVLYASANFAIGNAPKTCALETY